MPSFNKVILLGNLTRDPEIRVTPSGASICKFGIATSRSVRSMDSNVREETLFIDIDAFGKQAELIGKHMTKGRAILIEGRLRLDQWESASGEKRNKVVVVLENFQFIGSRMDSDPNMAAYGSSEVGDVHLAEDLSEKKSNVHSPVSEFTDIDEDIPF